MVVLVDLWWFFFFFFKDLWWFLYRKNEREIINKNKEIIYIEKKKNI